LTKFLPAGGAGRGIPARRAGASPVTSAFGAEDGWGNPATGPGERQLKCSRYKAKADLKVGLYGLNYWLI
jgi:hypothetical protein